MLIDWIDKWRSGRRQEMGQSANRGLTQLPILTTMKLIQHT